MSWFNLCSVVLKFKNVHISKHIEFSRNWLGSKIPNLFKNSQQHIYFNFENNFKNEVSSIIYKTFFWIYSFENVALLLATRIVAKNYI